MTANNDIGASVERLIEAYGTDPADGTGNAPGAAAWRRLMERDPDRPVTVINFFKLRDVADYPEGTGLGGSGQEAFDRYASVSVPSMQSTGGEFLFVGPVEGGFMGATEDWDIAAIGRYPNTRALLSLFEIDAYRDCFIHRKAACARQQVMICDG